MQMHTWVGSCQKWQSGFHIPPCSLIKCIWDILVISYQFGHTGYVSYIAAGNGAMDTGGGTSV
jgi:hypothetical protein